MNLRWIFLIVVILVLATQFLFTTVRADEPMRVAVIGLTHTHVHWILGRPERGDIRIVGIVEPNTELAQRYTKQHGLAMNLVFPSMQRLVKNVELDAVTAFGSTYQHLEVVRFFAPRGVHVMVEKPLAVSLDHARQMAKIAAQHNIHLLTNYETSWYPSNHRAFEILNTEEGIGRLSKVVVHSGHRGPQEIGCNQEFLDWLTDPKLSGGGAVTDFGCYGVNLINWLTNNQRPTSVSAVLQQLKPEVYPKVDDEATIVLKYPTMQGIVQASWNWPISRKDMEVYGTAGQIICRDRHQIEIRSQDSKPPRISKLPELDAPMNDPFAYFAAVVSGKIKPGPRDLSSLQNNLLVVEILEAAIQSAKQNRAISLSQ